MTYNTASGDTPETLHERVVRAIAREWGITEVEAEAAIERATVRRQQLGPEVAQAQVWAMFPEPRRPVEIDLTETPVD